MKTYFAPGRINLIGEHLDYNGGLVLPAALSVGITATYTPLPGDDIILQSATHSYVHRGYINQMPGYNPTYEWANYPLGVIAQLHNEGYPLSGCQITYHSSLPEGSGLSSSAAIEVLTAYLLASQTSNNINRVWLANLCRQVENEYIGMQCGIMDQYAVALGKQGHALLIDCASLQHNYIPFETGDYRLLIINTNKPRKLVHSKYNERRAECEEALHILQQTQGDIENLCDAAPHLLPLITDPVLYNRAKHVVSENLRVKESIKALRFNDLSTFGRLMNASHQSLQYDYEVSGIELDTVVETAQQVKGCLGARMTGAGFGGCAIAIVHQQAVSHFTTTVTETYERIIGYPCTIFESEIGDGVSEKLP